jgi:hypothetical protein
MVIQVFTGENNYIIENVISITIDEPVSLEVHTEETNIIISEDKDGQDDK